jgi:hypothetical protein
MLDRGGGSHRVDVWHVVAHCHHHLPLARTGLGSCPLETGFFSKKNNAAAQGEYIVVSGGPALQKWEILREDDEPHDVWWGNPE